MKITRTINGEEMVFELTAFELGKAYREQKRAYLLEELTNVIDMRNESLGFGESAIDAEKLLANSELCDAIIETYEEILYTEDGYDWQDALAQHKQDLEEGVGYSEEGDVNA